MNETNSGIKQFFPMDPASDVSSSKKPIHQSTSKPESPSNSVSSSSQSEKSPNLVTITLKNINDSSQDSLNYSSCSGLVSSTTFSPKGLKDDRKKSNHNEVERRRRDNINKWIVELSKIIPECCNDQSKHGQSKSGILEKTVQYLVNIKEENEILCSKIRSLEGIESENEVLKRKIDDYLKENEEFRKKLHKENILENKT